MRFNWLGDFEDWIRGKHYTWRGWVMAGFFLILAGSRWHSERELLPLGLWLTVAGCLWRMYAGRFIDSHSNSLQLSANSLATAGPYAFSRHPLYLANVLVGTGTVLFANCLPIWGAGILILLLLTHHAVLATTEEYFMLETCGAPYEDYLKSTPKWLGLPRRVPMQRSGVQARRPIPGVWKRQWANLAKTFMALGILWALVNIG